MCTSCGNSRPPSWTYGASLALTSSMTSATSRSRPAGSRSASSAASGVAANWRQRTPHLPQRRCAIGKELQPQLTEHNPELAILERKRERAALIPLDRHSARQSLRTGNGEHAPVHIQPSDMPTLPNARRRDPRNDARTARHIQHPVAGPHPHPLHEVDRPRQRHRRNEVALIKLGRITLELPPLRIADHAHPPHDRPEPTEAPTPPADR